MVKSTSKVGTNFYLNEKKFRETFRGGISVQFRGKIHQEFRGEICVKFRVEVNGTSEEKVK